MAKALKITLILMCTIFYAGCSTIASLIEQPVGSSSAQKPFVGCDSIPRVFGGVSLYYCVVVKGHWDEGGEFVGIILYDLPFSLVMDTVILPYTVVQQIRKGNNTGDPTQSNGKL